MTDIDRDLTALQVWISAQPGGEAFHLVVHRFVARPGDRQIGYVLLVGPGDDVFRRRIRCDVHRVLLAWGWQVRLEPGRDTFDVHPDVEYLTAHQRVAALLKVHEALDGRSP